MGKIKNSPKGASIIDKILLIISLIILVNPNYNTIDVFPDFIAYLILAVLVKRLAPLAPYFEEVRVGLMKLSLVTLAKIPMMLVMLANMSSGSDIVPLLTLVFVVIELMLLYPLIGNLFSALFYLGERTSGTSLLARFRVLGIPVSPEFVRATAFVFVTAKGVLNFIPELCLLTSIVDTTIALMRRLYPMLVISCILAVLVLGIITLVIGIGYINSVAGGGSIYEAALGLAGDERLERLEYERGVERRLFGLTLLFVAALLLFDIKIALDGSVTTDLTSLEVNLLPRCLFAITLMLAIPRLTDRRSDRLFIYIAGGLYSLATVATTVSTALYNTDFSYADLIDNQGAKSAYLYVTVCEVAELLFFVAMAVCLVGVLYRFVNEHTGIKPGNDYVSRSDIEHKHGVRVKAILLGVFPIVIAVLKAINAFIVGNPQLIYSDPTDITMPIIVASGLPWFGLLIFVLTVAYAFFAFYTTGELRSEVKLKYSNEDSTFE